MTGKYPDTGVVEPQFSLPKLVGGFLYFSKEITQIHYVGEQLAVNLYLAPKVHADIADEGVEYYWYFIKGLL